MDTDQLRKAINAGRYEWREHTILRLAQRNILQGDALEVIMKGEIVEEYEKDFPFPSCLMMKRVKDRFYHVVVSFDKGNNKAYIITVYEPGVNRFEPDLKTRRR